jgi:hypothetical protein
MTADAAVITIHLRADPLSPASRSRSHQHPKVQFETSFIACPLSYRAEPPTCTEADREFGEIRSERWALL